MPTPRITRPLDTRSSVITSSATRTGWWSGSRMTEVPTRSVLVRAATAVATMSGDADQPVGSQQRRDLLARATGEEGQVVADRRVGRDLLLDHVGHGRFIPHLTIIRAGRMVRPQRSVTHGRRRAPPAASELSADD